MTQREYDGGGRSLGKAAHRALVFVGIVALALLLWQIVDALLLVFFGILVAVFLRGLATRLADRTPLSTGWSLAVVGLVLIALMGAAGFLLGPQIGNQFSELRETVPQTVEQVMQNLQKTSWGQALLTEMKSSGGGLRPGGQVFSRLTGVASGTLSMLTNSILILFTAIFFAADPGLYRRGVLLLVPERKTERVDQTLDACGQALWRWLMGRFVAMLFVGIITSVGLMLVGVPLALSLGLIAGILDFVPFVGPIAASVPGILLGLTVSPMHAVYAALVYLGAQQIEGNIVTPLVQREAVSLPPVLVLFSVVAGGLLFGILGIIVATPLVVVIMVFTKMLYVEDALGKSVDVPGRG